MQFPEKTFIIGIFIYFLLALTGLYNTSQRPALPMSMEETDQGVYLYPAAGKGQEGSFAPQLISSLDHYAVEHIYQANAVINRKKIGDTVTLRFQGDGVQQVKLTSYYGFWHLFLNFFIGAIFFVIGGLIWWNRENSAERLFPYSGFLFGFIIIMNWGGIQLPLPISLPLISLYFLSYPLAFLTFCLFSNYFPAFDVSMAEVKVHVQRILVAAALFSLPLILFFLRQTFDFSLATVDQFYLIYRLFRFIILAIMLFALIQLIRNLLRQENPEHRRKLHWVLWGVFWGSFPFIFLWNLPQIFGFSPLTPEWIANLAILFIPITVAIAILRHRLFDIEIVISRSLIYSIVLFSLMIIYLLTALALSALFLNRFSLHSPLASALAALFIALIFNPLKTRVQNQVDRQFYRIKYDRFQVLRSFMAGLERLLEKGQVLQELERAFQKAVPVEKQETFFVEKEGLVSGGEEVAKATQFLEWFRSQPDGERGRIFIHPSGRERLESGLRFAGAPLPERYLILIALNAQSGWLLGEKRSGQRFWKEDLDLASQMAAAASAQLEKIAFMENYLREALEREKAEQLNAWKSLLVAEVAHDLRSPLNAILFKLKNLAHALNEGKNDWQNSALEIQKQVRRLQNLIQSLLAFSAIEKGKLSLRLIPLTIQSIVGETLDILQETIEKKRLNVRQDLPPSLRVLGDPQFLQEIFLNILSNAVKFSAPGKTIHIKGRSFLRRNERRVEIEICDQAGGMTSAQIKEAFEPFRSRQTPRPGEGFHLGLYIVRQFTELMNGEVQIESQKGSGTTFLLSFPAP
ncbi:ATP-binding protein [Caldithrix abyssi]